jgi:hypothetical protein
MGPSGSGGEGSRVCPHHRDLRSRIVHLLFNKSSNRRSKCIHSVHRKMKGILARLAIRKGRILCRRLIRYQLTQMLSNLRG